MSPYGDALVEWQGSPTASKIVCERLYSIPKKRQLLRRRRSKRKKRDFEKIEASSFAPTPSLLVQSTRLFAKQTKFEPFYFCNEKQLLCSCFVVETTGLANSEHLNASVHCDRGHNLCEAQDCLQGKQWFEPF